MLDTLLSVWPDFAFIKDRQSRFLKVNSVMARVLGADNPGDLIGKSDFDCFPPEDAQRFYEREQALMAGAFPVISDEERSRGRVWLTTKMPFRDERGDVAGLIGISRDITDRIEKEQARATLAGIANSVPGMVYQYYRDEAGRELFPFVSQGAKELFGIEPEAVMADPSVLFDLTIEEDRELVQRITLEQATEMGAWICEYRARTPQGVRWFRGHALPTPMPEGGVLWNGIIIDISERKQADAQIRFQAGLLDAVGQAVIATDTTGAVIYWNRFAERLYGWPASEVIGRSILELTTAPEAAKEGAAIVARLSRGESWSGEFPVRRRDGSVFIAQVVNTPITDEAGGLIGIIGVSSDMTEWKRAERELADAKRRAEMILESISDGFYALDNEWRFTYVNAAAERMLGRRKGQLVGRNVLDEFPEALDAGVYGGYVAAKQQNQQITFEVFSPALDSWFELHAYPHADGLSVYFRDVSERHRTQDALQQSRRELEAALEANRAIFAHSLDVICSIDAAGAFVQVSQHSLEVWGYTPEELVGRPYIDLVHPDDREATRIAAKAIMAGTTTSNLDNRYLRKDGTVVHNLWSAAWSEPHGLMFAVARDITQRLLTEDKLRQAQKMEAVGQLTGGVAHDFNNLLMVILGNAEVLAEDLEDQEYLRDAAQHIVAAADHGAELTSRLLAFSRKQTLAPAPLDPDEVVQGVEMLLGRTLGEQIEIRTELPAGVARAVADRVQLEAALLNLAVNARDAMPEGGRLTIRVSDVQVDGAGLLDWPDAAPGSYVRFEVSDTGAGMPARVVERAFEPFFTTKEVGKGSGLGLAMVYGFAKQSGGHAAIVSGLGCGTTVTLYLPAVTAPEQEGDVAAEARPTLSRGAETILVVEDEPEVRRFVVEQLRHLGYGVVEAADGPAALEDLELDESIDLLFSDVMLPKGLSGPLLAAEALRRRPDLKILFTSGYPEETFERHRSLVEPEIQLLRKPYRRAELAAALRSALDSPGPGMRAA